MSITIDCQCFPCIYYFKKLSEVKHVKLELYENFQKASFRNRFIIASANGLTSLTIPVKGGRESKKIIGEIEIDKSDNWQTKHWRSIVSAYKKAPYFEYYENEVQRLLFNDESRLFYFNYEILTGISKWLNINLQYDFTGEYKRVVEGVDLRDTILPKNFQAYEGVQWPVYSQVFEDRLGFQPNLSVLDLLFCEGPNAKNVLENWSGLGR